MPDVRRLSIATGIIVVSIVATSGWRPAAAQATRSDDVLPALLTEVKGLRAAMEQMASTNAHAQLLVGRLQLQEGRIAGMVRRLDTVRDSVATASREHAQIEGSLKMFDADKSSGEAQPDGEGLLSGIKAHAAAT